MNYNPEALTRVIAEYKAEAAAPLTRPYSQTVAERAARDPEFAAGLLEAMLHVVSPTHRTSGVPITYRPEKRSGAYHRWIKALGEIAN